jgi:hypothetical protein
VERRKVLIISYKTTARTVGVLFIIATVAGAASAAVLGSILDSAGLLDNVAANEAKVLAAVFLDLVLVGAVVAIPVVMFPILRQHTEGVARGYFAARMVEGMIIMAGALALLTLVTVSQESADLGGGSSVFGATGAFLLAAREWTDLIGTQLVFGVTALILNLSMFRSLLVPRFISIWGLIGATLAVVSSLSSMFLGLDPFSTTSILLFLPIAIQEMVMAGWFIVKGFNLSAMGPESAETTPAMARNV